MGRVGRRDSKTKPGTQGRMVERAEAAREKKERAAYSQGAEDPPAAPHDNGWRPPSDVGTEDM